jgi:hypothetical protein
VTLDDVQRALARVCLAPSPDGGDIASLGDAPARWHLYRALVRGRFVETLGDALPGTRRALGDAGLDACVTAWLDRAPPTTRYVRELSIDFARLLDGSPEVIPADAAPWTRDMARYEAAVMHAHIAFDAPPDDPAVGEFDMALAPALCPAQRFVRVDYGVHRGGEPEPTPFALVVYRAPATDAVEVLELTPIAGDIYELFTRGDRSVTACAQEALARHDASAGALFVESFAALLGDFMDRGILLGGRAVEPWPPTPP